MYRYDGVEQASHGIYYKTIEQDGPMFELIKPYQYFGVLKANAYNDTLCIQLNGMLLFEKGYRWPSLFDNNHWLMRDNDLFRAILLLCGYYDLGRAGLIRSRSKGRRSDRIYGDKAFLQAGLEDENPFYKMYLYYLYIRLRLKPLWDGKTLGNR